MDQEGLSVADPMRRPPSSSPIRHVSTAMSCIAVLMLAPGPAIAQIVPLPRGAAQAPADLQPFVGGWDLELLGSPRKCTITLGLEAVANGRQLRFPAICRRALPVLAQAASWSVTAAGQPRLNDAAGAVVIAFARAAPNADLEGKGLDGQRYGLASKDHPRAAVQRLPSAAERAATAAARPTATDPALAPPSASLPGHYVMMRQANREACRLVLLNGPAGAAGRLPAAFEGRCDDTGLTIFDPAGWRYEAGRLSLIARRGHSVELVFENGQWRKDPAVGAPLMLKKLP